MAVGNSRTTHLPKLAALFLPFLSQVLAVGFGAWCGDRALVRKGAAALLTSAVLAYCAGAVVAMVTGGPIRFQDFKGPLASFAISTVIGVAAGLSTADDSGRRYLIGNKACRVGRVGETHHFSLARSASKGTTRWVSPTRPTLHALFPMR